MVESRSEKDADAFVKDFRRRLAVICDVNSDGLETYPASIKHWFGGSGDGVDYSQLAKSFSGRRG